MTSLPGTDQVHKFLLMLGEMMKSQLHDSNTTVCAIIDIYTVQDIKSAYGEITIAW